MIYLRVLLVLIPFFFWGCGNSSEDENNQRAIPKIEQNKQLVMLELRNIQLSSILSEILQSEQESYDGRLEEIIIAVNITKTMNKIEVRMVAIEKDLLIDFFEGTSAKPFGFSEHDGVTIVVCGEDPIGFFKRKNTKKTFPFLKTKRPLTKESDGTIPIVIEPFVWLYLYENHKFELIMIDRIGL